MDQSGGPATLVGQEVERVQNFFKSCNQIFLNKVYNMFIHNLTKCRKKPFKPFRPLEKFGRQIHYFFSVQSKTNLLENSGPANGPKEFIPS